MVKGNDKLDGVSKKIEQDHNPVKSELLKYDKRSKSCNSGINSQNDSNNINIGDNSQSDDNNNIEDDMEQNDNHNGEDINVQNDNDVVMRDMTPFVSVEKAKFTTDSRVDISYDRRRFTDVCFLSLLFLNLFAFDYQEIYKNIFKIIYIVLC